MTDSSNSNNSNNFNNSSNVDLNSMSVDEIVAHYSQGTRSLNESPDWQLSKQAQEFISEQKRQAGGEVTPELMQKALLNARRDFAVQQNGQAPLGRGVEPDVPTTFGGKSLGSGQQRVGRSLSAMAQDAPRIK